MAWHPLGWEPFGFAEIEAFPSAVLGHHYGSNMPDELWKPSNGVPNFGNMENFKEWPDGAIDLLVECERLQGFPDGYTDIPYRGKPAADGPRYKALGNSMAVNVMRWLGRRIELVRS